MKAAFYTEYGVAREVLKVGELPDPQPGPGEVRVRVRFSGINPSDCNRRLGIRDRPGYPLIIPHSDGSGEIDAVGEGVSQRRIGEKVWIWNAQRGRPFGTSAEYIALPSRQAVRLPDGATLEDGACFGVPAMTAYYSLFAADRSRARTSWSRVAPAPSASTRCSSRGSLARARSSRR